MSNFSCKFFRYYENSVTPMAHYVLAFVSIERFLTIVYPNQFRFKNKIKFQITLCLAIVVFNLIFYVPSFVSFGLVVNTDNHEFSITNISSIAFNETNIYCSRNIIFLNYLNVLNDVIIPFGVMMIFSLLLIISIHVSRKRARSQEGHSSIPSKTKSKYIRFAISSTAVNLVFFSFTLPYYVTFFIDTGDNDDLIIMIEFFSFLYDCKFSSIFFVNYFTNSLFRNEMRCLIGIDKKKSNEERTPNAAK
jgi:hypothetical protein